ncbi:MAG TPA: outer membrane beta-barrel protein [Candidatus Angelobacter sp.]
MTRVIILFSVLLISTVALAQPEQEYVSRYTAFAGYSYLNSPKLNLAERGFNVEFGVNVTRWLALGADYSYFTGHSDIFAQDLTPAIQLQLSHVVPPGVLVFLPFDSTTYTFTAGPQFNYRGAKWATFFARPALGGLHETANLKPNTPLTTLLVAQLVPSGSKSDLEVFYGFGGGFELIPTKHFGLQFAADFVHVNLFQGFLGSGRNSLRLSVGPTFRFGKNVK